MQDRYGPPEVLRVTEMARPVPGDRDVLVEVIASTVTRGDAMRVRSDRYRFTRLFIGIRRPRAPVCGSEFSGRVAEVGSAVTSFRVGDEVFGLQQGANAEYVVVPASGVIAPVPAGVDPVEAAAVPDGSLLALSCLRPAEPLAGRRVLVYGAAGSIGTAAVQLLVHHHGADVTAVCDTSAVDTVRDLGAHEVIDRLAQDFTARGETYDVIFDAVGKHSFRRCRRALTPTGMFITLDLGFGYHVPLLALLTRLVGRRRAVLGMGRYRREDLLVIAGLAETGRYRPVIDRRYPIDDVVEATRYVESGTKTGNVVLTIRDEPVEGLPERAR